MIDIGRQLVLDNDNDNDNDNYMDWIIDMR